MFACIHIPGFPVEAIVRVEPLLREQALAVLEGKPPLTRVVALNQKALQMGMQPGMTRLQTAPFAASGNSRSKTLLRPRSPEQETSAHAALLDAAHAFTPRVEDTAPGTLLLDLTGMGRLYGSPARMAHELASRTDAIGLKANVALAANPDAAMLAALGFDSITVIPAGKEAQRLGVLPLPVLLEGLGVLERKAERQPRITRIRPRENAKSAVASERQAATLRQQLLDTLERWGVRDCRTLALLPEHALASRLGETGTRLQRMARGTSLRTLVLSDPPSRFEEAMELECAVEDLESLSFILNRLLEQLCTRLEARALAAQELRLRLQRERRVAGEETMSVEESSRDDANAAIFERALRLPVAMREAKVFLKLLQLDLAAHPPGAPVIKVWITAEPAPPRSAQRGLFLPVIPEAERLEITLARVSSVVGERRLGIARVLDTHRRDSSMERFTAGEPRPDEGLTIPQNAELPLALRIFRPALPLQVTVVQGRPAIVCGGKRPCGLAGEILWSAGPWHSSGDWWTEQSTKLQAGAWDREEWDVAMGHGENVALYRIHRDKSSGKWFADASYD